MAKVLGIGGVFLRARDPEALRRFYAEALEVAVEPWGAVLEPDHTESSSIFSIFSLDSDHLGDPSQQAMINFRVEGLEEICQRLVSLGAPVEPIVDDEHGRFAWARDPEGNKFELWEPR